MLSRPFPTQVPVYRRPPHPLKQRYPLVDQPKENEMTICIGALASGGLFKPDTIVMACDTMGSFGDGYSSPGLYKMFTFADERLYICASDNVDKAAELCSIIRDNVRRLPHREHGAIQAVLQAAVWDYHRQRSLYEVLPKYLLTPQEWAQTSLDRDLRETVALAVMSYYFGCQLIIGTFADSGQALLYRVDGVGLSEPGNWDSIVEFVRSCNFPGFTAIGSGSENALFWLAYRNHVLGYNPRRAAYHVYEAKRMAETSAHVNNLFQFVIANRDSHTLLSDKTPERNGWSLNELQEMFSKKGPQSTEEIGAIA